MIIENGTMQTCTITGGGMEKGRPIPVQQELGPEIPCNIRTQRNNLHGKSVDGVFRQTDFEVLIDTDTAPVIESDKVVLTDNRGQTMGVFWVQDIQYLDYVQAIKIDVCHAD